MGIADGHRRIVEKKKREWLEFVDRFGAAGLRSPEHLDFSGANQPTTRKGWESYKLLLEKEGGLNSVEEEKMRRGVERIRIHEKEEVIKTRLRFGGALPDPDWPSTAPKIPADVGLTSGASDVLMWTAICELGLSNDDFYRPVLKRAQLQMYRIARNRGDFNNLPDSNPCE